MMYKGIRDTAKHIGVEPHTLRFWETKFPYLNPKKMSGNNRLYTPDDIRYLEKIYHYLKIEGYTTQGVVNLIKKHGIQAFRDESLGKNTHIAIKNTMLDTSEHHKDMTGNINTKHSILCKDVENILSRLKKMRTMLDT